MAGSTKATGKTNVGLGLLLLYCGFVLLFFVWNTSHVEFRISNSQIQTPQFQPQTSNPKFLSPAFKSKAPKANFRISNSGKHPSNSQSPTWF